MENKPELVESSQLARIAEAEAEKVKLLASIEPVRSDLDLLSPEVLERVWWRLDRALDAESVYLSGLVGAIEAALSGTTLVIDHHASPSFIRGSLDLLRRAYIFSAMEHRNQVRRSGEPYLTHPLEVAYILADLKLDMTSVAVGLLSGPALRRLGERRFAAYGIAVLAVAVALRAVPDDPLAWTCSAAIGAGLPAVLIATLTAVQRETPAPLLGRVTATANTLVHAPNVLGLAAGAALVELLDHRLLLATAGCALTATAATLLGHRAHTTPT